MSDESVDLRFLSRQLKQVFAELGTLRDDVGVPTAITMRLDGTVSGLLNEDRAMHSQHGRLQNRVKALESASSEKDSP